MRQANAVSQPRSLARPAGSSDPLASLVGRLARIVPNAIERENERILDALPSFSSALEAHRPRVDNYVDTAAILLREACRCPKPTNVMARIRNQVRCTCQSRCICA